MKDQHLIYGEITVKGIHQFAKLEPKVNNFMDIGSGYGKLPWVMKYFFNYNNCYGIEIDKEKFKFSTKHFKTRKDNEVVYKYGHFKHHESLIKKMDVIYCNCVAWPLEMVEELHKILENCVFYHNNTSFAFKYMNIHSGRVSIDMSWSDQINNYYKLNTNTNR
jgi:ribosomal protein L11 methylase PrmA